MDQILKAFQLLRNWGRHRAHVRFISIIAFSFIVFYSQASPAIDSIRVAAIFSETGIAASHNLPSLRMTKLAIEQINKNGGILNKQVELSVIDNKSTPIGAALAAQKAIDLDVVAVIGALWSSHSLAMAPILQKAGIPMISPGSTNPEVTEIGDYIFRACFIDSFQGVAMARFARSHLAAQQVAVVTNIDEKYSITLARYFKEGFINTGGEVMADLGYRGNATDYSEIIEKLKKLHPDIIYIPGYTRDSGLFIKQARKMGLSSTFLGGDGWDDIDTYAGSDINGSFQTVSWHPDVPYKKSKELRQIFNEKYDKEIGINSGPLTYDAVMLLKEAIAGCECIDKKKVRNSIAATRNFEGATGQITFNENGDPQHKGVIIVQFENRESKFIKTVYPAKLKLSKK